MMAVTELLKKSALLTILLVMGLEAIIDHFRSFSGCSGSLWLIFGFLWGILGHYGSHWIVMDRFGSIWVVTDCFGSFWHFMDSFGLFWLIPLFRFDGKNIHTFIHSK